MYGPGLAPPPPPGRPSTALLVLVRLVFVAVSVCSVGFLCWAGPLRIAVMLQTKRAWGLFWLSVAVPVFSLAVLMAEPTDDVTTAAGVFAVVLLLAAAFGFAGYYLHADVRHYRGRPPRGYVAAAPPVFRSPAPHTQSGPPPYRTPSSSTPYPPVQQPAQHTPTPNTPPRHAPTPPANPVPPAPARPAPARIDQVRAELDELSDYLRRQEQSGGDSGGDSGGGPPAQAPGFDKEGR